MWWPAVCMIYCVYIVCQCFEYIISNLCIILQIRFANCFYKQENWSSEKLSNGVKFMQPISWVGTCTQSPDHSGAKSCVFSEVGTWCLNSHNALMAMPCLLSCLLLAPGILECQRKKVTHWRSHRKFVTELGLEPCAFSLDLRIVSWWARTALFPHPPSHWFQGWDCVKTSHLAGQSSLPTAYLRYHTRGHFSPHP